MIYLYGEFEMTGKAISEATGKNVDVPWLEQEIVLVRHKRTEIDGDSGKAWAKKQDGYDAHRDGPATGKPSYRHYVPYQRIFNALQLVFLGKKRKDILLWMLSGTPYSRSPCLINTLQIDAPDWLPKLGDPSKSRMAFDCAIDWATTRVCFWHANYYYGFGTGDRQGRALDVPTTPKIGPTQKERVEAAARTLKANIPTLDLAPEVDVAYLYEKEYNSGNAPKRAVEISNDSETVVVQAAKKQRTLAIDDLLAETDDDVVIL